MDTIILDPGRTLTDAHHGALTVKEPRERGVFVQGGFRANTAIVGLAYAMTAYGDEGIAIASLYLTVTVILFNVLSVITLTRSLQGGQGQKIKHLSLLRSIVTNPLILGLVSGLAYAQTGLGIPQVIKQTGSYISGLSLPLALLCTGASLDLRAMFRSSNVAALSSSAKLFLVPVLMTLGGWLWGFHGATLGIIFMFSATPTASGSYVMTRAMGGNATLAANIIAITTVGSFFTTVSERRSHIVNEIPLSHPILSQYNEPEVKYDNTVFSQGTAAASRRLATERNV